MTTALQLDEKQFPPNPDTPVQVAETFVERSRIPLGFTERSLRRGFEACMSLWCVRGLWLRGGSWSGLVVSGTSYDLETCASCYFGETLRRLHSGNWTGHCGNDGSPNFYTLAVKFGDYVFFPSHYVAYRISNGRRDTGRVGDCLDVCMSSMRDGTDHRRAPLPGPLPRGNAS